MIIPDFDLLFYSAQTSDNPRSQNNGMPSNGVGS